MLTWSPDITGDGEEARTTDGEHGDYWLIRQSPARWSAVFFGHHQGPIEHLRASGEPAPRSGRLPAMSLTGAKRAAERHFSRMMSRRENAPLPMDYTYVHAGAFYEVRFARRVRGQMYPAYGVSGRYTTKREAVAAAKRQADWIDTIWVRVEKHRPARDTETLVVIYGAGGTDPRGAADPRGSRG